MISAEFFKSSGELIQAFQAELDEVGATQAVMMQNLTSWEEKGRDQEWQTIALKMLQKKLSV